jgi:hypothetical protein
MKPAVIRQVGTPQLFRGTKPFCICVYYYNKKEKYRLRKLLHLCSTKACHFKSLDCSEMEGINMQKVPLFIYVRVLISDDGPMLQIRSHRRFK